MISEQTEEIIAVIRRTSCEMIKGLKKLNRSAKDITEFKQVQIDRNRIIFLKEELAKMGEVMNESVTDQLKYLYDDCVKTKESLADKERQIKCLKGIVGRYYEQSQKDEISYNCRKCKKCKDCVKRENTKGLS